MSETTNPKTMPTLDTKILGVADAKAEDLAGYILNPKEVEEAVTKVFTLLGVEPEDIRCVKVATDAESHPHIITEVLYKAVKATGGCARTRSWTDFADGDSETGSKDALDRRITDALRNKAYYAKSKKYWENLKWKKVVRGDTKYAQIEFDPYIFVAFVYNINYADRFYKISAPATRWPSDREMDELSGKERKKRIRTIQEYKNENIRPSVFYVTFRKNSQFKLNNGNFISGFHPEEVEYVYSEYEENSGKKKKKHHN